MIQTSRRASGLSRFAPTLVFGAASLFVALSACSREPSEPVAASEYPESYAETAFLRIRDGSLERWDPSPLSPREGAPASVTPSVAAIAAADGRSAVIAVNRNGLVRARIDPETRRYRLERIGGGGEFAGRSVGSLVCRSGRVFCLLYRDPVFETEPPRETSSAFLSLDLSDERPELRSYDLNLGEEGKDLFALFPLPEGVWVLQLRKEIPNGVESVFRSFDPVTGEVRPMDRSDFESALTPRPLSAAPEPLRRAALLLAPEGCPVVVSASLADGSRAAYSFGDGEPDNSVELRGSATEAGTALCAWNAVASVVRDGMEHAFHLPTPAEGAVYRDIVPLEGAVLAIWEIGVFPNVEESGVVLLPAP